MLLARLTRPELKRYREREDRILFPIGSTEQHGPRGVFGTDGLIAWELAESVGEQCGLLVAPLLPYGMSEHHLSFTGSVSLRPGTLISVVSDILRSFFLSGFRRIAIVNGHGGNTAPLSCAVTCAADSCPEIQVKLLEWFAFDSVRSFLEETFGEHEGLHGTPGELSLILAMFDGLIAKDLQSRQEQSDTDVCLTRKMLEERFADGSINADQNLANKEVGERLLQLCKTAMVREMASWKPGAGDVALSPEGVSAISPLATGRLTS
jgi:creatinine amidohydrolase